MNRFRMLMAAGAVASSMVAGGVIGAAVTSGTAMAATTPSPSATSATTTPPGTFTPNEDPTHEAGESAAREAQDDAGQRPTVP